MKPSTTHLLLGAVLLTLGSCKTSSQAAGGAAYSASNYHQPWPAYKTFYINPVSETGPSLTPLNQQRIVALVTAQMVTKGLTKGDATADLVVNIVSVDSSKVGQHAGRPDNELFRVFHGGDSSPAAPEILTGSLLPPDTVPAVRRGAKSKRDSALSTVATADSARAGLAKRDSARAALAKADSDRLASSSADSARSAKASGGSAGVMAGPSKDSLPVSGPKPAPPYVYGALIVEVIDKKQRLLLWEGVANKPVDVPMKDPDKRISAFITRLMQRFSLSH